VEVIPCEAGDGAFWDGKTALQDFAEPEEGDAGSVHGLPQILIRLDGSDGGVVNLVSE